MNVIFRNRREETAAKRFCQDLASYIFASTLIISGLMFFVGVRLALISSAYELSKHLGIDRRLHIENSKLTVEVATLKSPARLERIAFERLELRRPNLNEMRYIRVHSERQEQLAIK